MSRLYAPITSANTISSVATTQQQQHGGQITAAQGGAGAHQGAQVPVPGDDPPDGFDPLAHIGYWSNPHRGRLYPIPPDDDPIWITINHVWTAAQGRRVRILRSANTPGTIVSMVDQIGIARVTDWTYLPDLLFFNPLEYFVAHANIESVWVENIDTDEQQESDAETDPTGLHTVGSGSVAGAQSSHASNRSARSDQSVQQDYALVVRRGELNHASALLIHNQQMSFFLSHNLGLPPHYEFADTLHNR